MANLLDLFAISLSDTDQSFSFNAICSSIKSIASQSLTRLNSFIDGGSQGMNIVIPTTDNKTVVAHVTSADFTSLMDSDEQTVSVSAFSSDGSTSTVEVSEDELVDALSTSVTLNQLLTELATAVASSTSMEDLSTKLTVIKSAYVAKGDQQSARIIDTLLSFVMSDSDQQSFKSAAMSWLIGLMGSTTEVSEQGEAIADFGRLSNFSDYSVATPVVAWANSLDSYASWPAFLEGIKKVTAPVVAAITAIGKGIITLGYKVHSKVKELFTDPKAYGNNTIDSFNAFIGRDDFIDSFILPFNMPDEAAQVGKVDPNVKLQKLVSDGSLPNIPEYSSWNDICMSFELGYIYNFDFPGAVVSVQRVHTDQSVWVSNPPPTGQTFLSYPDVRDYIRVAVRPKALSKQITYPDADVRGYPLSISEFNAAAYTALSYGWNGSIVGRTLQYGDDDHIAAFGFQQGASVYTAFALSLLGTYKQGSDGASTDTINNSLINKFILSSLPAHAYFEPNWGPSCSHYDGKEVITPVDDLNLFKTSFSNAEDVSNWSEQYPSNPGQFYFADSYGAWIPTAARAENQGWADTFWNMEPLIAVLLAYIAKESVYFVPYTKQLSYPRGTYRLMTTADQTRMFSSFAKGSLIAVAVIAGSVIGAKVVKGLKGKVLISGAALQQFRMKFDGSTDQLKVLRKLNRTATFWNKVYGFVVGGVSFSALSNAVKKTIGSKDEVVDANSLIYNAIVGTHY